MTPQNRKTIGIACFIVGAICLFIAFERYQANASTVNAMRNMTQSMPMGMDSPLGDIRPATPASTKYALFFALLSAAGGIYFVSRPREPKKD
jgi:hypothetical protein